MIILGSMLSLAAAASAAGVIAATNAALSAYGPAGVALLGLVTAAGEGAGCAVAVSHPHQLHHGKPTLVFGGVYPTASTGSASCKRSAIKLFP